MEIWVVKEMIPQDQIIMIQIDQCELLRKVLLSGRKLNHFILNMIYVDSQDQVDQMKVIKIQDQVHMTTIKIK